MFQYSLFLEPKPALRQSVAMAFDDMESMLKDLSDSLGPIAEWVHEIIFDILTAAIVDDFIDGEHDDINDAEEDVDDVEVDVDDVEVDVDDFEADLDNITCVVATDVDYEVVNDGAATFKSVSLLLLNYFCMFMIVDWNVDGLHVL